MLGFILKRLLEAIPTLLLLITVTFVLMHAAPGSPLTGERSLPPEIQANLDNKYGLNKPLHQQYFDYLDNLLHGDLGPSFKYKDHTVNGLIAESFPVSAKIGFLAFVVAVLFGVLFGVIAALNQNSWIDYSVMSLAMAGVVIPAFVLAPLLVLVFAVNLQWLPAGGWNGGQWIYVILPVLGMAAHYISSIARMMRGSMIEIMHCNFIRTARAKGLPARYIVFRHAIKPALLPVISYLGPAFVGILAGSLVIETIFGLPGIGQLFINGSLNRDYPLVLGITLLIGGLTILLNAVVDILYAFIDPKIRY